MQRYIFIIALSLRVIIVPLALVFNHNCSVGSFIINHSTTVATFTLCLHFHRKLNLDERIVLLYTHKKLNDI